MRTIQSLGDAQRLALATGAELEVDGRRFNAQRARISTAAPAPAAPAAAAPPPAPAAAAPAPVDVEGLIARMAEAITNAARRPAAPEPQPPAAPAAAAAAAPPPRAELLEASTMTLNSNVHGLISTGAMPLGDGRELLFEVKRDPYTQRAKELLFKVGG